MNEAVALRVLDLLIAAMDVADDFSVNWAEVKAAQERARAENRPLNADERQPFVDNMLSSVGSL